MTTVRLFMLAMLAGAAIVPARPASASGYRVVYAFKGTGDGARPGSAGFSSGGLVVINGFLYGTAAGVVFSINPYQNTERVIYSFTGGDDAAIPNEGLINIGNTVYGTSFIGGPPGNCAQNTAYTCGTVFSVDIAAGTEKVLYAFTKRAYGALPAEGLVDVDGTLYGTTSIGGNNGCPEGDTPFDGCGLVYAINPNASAATHAGDGVESVVHVFAGKPNAFPANLVNVSGMLYGTTGAGGRSPCQCGTVFSLDPKTGVKKTIYGFQGGTDGSAPSGLIYVDGVFYGTTSGGGSANQYGTVFALNPTTRVETVLYAFKGGSDGAYPGGVIAVNGLLYGTTAAGGYYDKGTIFAVNPQSGIETQLHTFSGAPDGTYPSSTLTPIGSTLFGLTSYGGPADLGTVFGYTP